MALVTFAAVHAAQHARQCIHSHLCRVSANPQVVLGLDLGKQVRDHLAKQGREHHATHGPLLPAGEAKVFALTAALRCPSGAEMGQR